MKKIFKFIKSIKLAVILISYILITSILTTLIPLGMSTEFYKQNYNDVISWLIINTGFNNYFQSLAFMIPVVLFTINLLICTIDRIVRRAMSGAKKRFGPDIIHIGLLLLIIGGMITLFSRVESLRMISVGEQASPSFSDISVLVKDFKIIKYPDGGIKDWLSFVEVYQEDELIKSGIIEVNKPMKVLDTTIYQQSYEDTHTIILFDPNTNKQTDMITGDYFETDDYIVMYTGNLKDENKSYTAVFEMWDKKKESLENTFVLSNGEKLGDLIIKSITIKKVTGLNFVKDFGVIPVIISLIVILLGMGITFIQKAGDNNL